RGRRPAGGFPCPFLFAAPGLWGGQLEGCLGACCRRWYRAPARFAHHPSPQMDGRGSPFTAGKTTSELCPSDLGLLYTLPVCAPWPLQISIGLRHSAQAPLHVGCQLEQLAVAF